MAARRGGGSADHRAAQRDAALRAARAAIERTRGRLGWPRQHRGVSRLAVTPASVASLVLLPALFLTVLLTAQDEWFGFWQRCILFWSAQLDIPLEAAAVAHGPQDLQFVWRAGASPPRAPDGPLLAVTAVITLGLFAASYRMPDRMLPLKYLLRILCTVQASALLFFALQPWPFPYTIAQHTRAVLAAGHLLMLAIPVMLALGYYLLPVPLLRKIGDTLLILGYFALAIPHLAVGHAWLLQHLSVLFMPLLFICFGAIFDMLLFVALYAWLASRVQADVTR